MITTRNIYKLYESRASIEEINQAFAEVDINSYDELNHDCTALHLAARNVNPTAIETLLDRGIDANVKDNEGYTPLSYLAKTCIKDKYNSILSTKILLENGAKIARSAKYSNALIIAIQNKQFAMAEVLIKSGQRFNSTTNDGENALHVLCNVAGNISRNIKNYEDGIKRDAFKFLPENAKEKEIQELEILRDYENQCKYIASLLLNNEQIDIDDKTDYGKTVHDISIDEKVLWLSKLLVGNGNTTGYKDIFQAIFQNDKEAVKQFVSKSGLLQTEYTDKEISMFYGKSPLACALLYSNFDIADIILKAGADPNYVFNDENTAFSSWMNQNTSDGTKEKYHDNLKSMSHNNWDVEKVADKEGNTPIGIACRHIYKNHAEVAANYLLDCKANVNIQNLSGQTPLMLLYGARYWNGQGIFGQPYGSKHCGEDELVFFEKLLEYGADIEIKDNWGNTILHYIMEDCYENEAKKALELLLDYREPDIEAVNNNGDTAMDIAVKKGYDSIIKLILKYS